MRFGRKKLGLALGSGGLRGFVHIGVIEALVDNDIPIDILTGTSAGAIVGGMYAAVGDIKKVRQTWENMKYRSLLKFFSDPVIFSSGILEGNKAIEYFRQFVGDAQIEDLKPKFAAVSTDIQSGEMVVHTEGDLATIMRCSSTIPMLMTPFKMGDRMLIDGGTSDPVPVDVAKNLGADVVIAVNLDSVFFSPTKQRYTRKPSSVETIIATIDLFRYHLARENVKLADIVINPNVPSDNMRNMRKATEIIERGYNLTIEQLPKIKKLLS